MEASFSRPHAVLLGARRGAIFGAIASLAIFGGVFLTIYGAGGFYLLYVWYQHGATAMSWVIEEHGGRRALEAEVMMALGRIVWLTASCTAASATLFAFSAAMSYYPAEDAHRPHPLDGAE
jgi:hypothetical protein